MFQINEYNHQVGWTFLSIVLKDIFKAFERSQVVVAVYFIWLVLYIVYHFVVGLGFIKVLSHGYMIVIFGCVVDLYCFLSIECDFVGLLKQSYLFNDNSLEFVLL